MTIIFHWWYISIILSVTGLYFILKRQSDWDFFTPMVGLTFIVGAMFYSLGHLF